MARATLKGTMLGLGLACFVVLISAWSVWAADPNRLENGYCKSGYVWRDSYPGDGLCVTPAQRAAAKAAALRALPPKQPSGGSGIGCQGHPNGKWVNGVCFF
jgi:hypothetical protein